MVTVDFYYSVSSRYSYLASTQVTALERDLGCKVNWIPLNGGELLSRKRQDPFAGEPISGQYEWAYRERDAQRWAAHYRIPYLEPRGRVQFDPVLLARAATAARRCGCAETYSHALFSAVFVDPAITVIDRAECARRAAVCDIPETEFLDELDDPLTESGHAAALQAADAAGVFGVPSFIVGGELFWGNDRLLLLRDYLQRGSAGT